jgi:hypothetical protein
MNIIRTTIGLAYITGILILAFDALYNLFAGILPPVFKSVIESPVQLILNISEILSFPVSFVLDRVMAYMPSFISGFYPVTTTDILGARIMWVPILALFLYTGILKAIDEMVLKSRVDNIHRQYKEKEDHQVK